MISTCSLSAKECLPRLFNDEFMDEQNELNENEMECLKEIVEEGKDLRGASHIIQYMNDKVEPAASKKTNIYYISALFKQLTRKWSEWIQSDAHVRETSQCLKQHMSFWDKFYGPRVYMKQMAMWTQPVKSLSMEQKIFHFTSAYESLDALLQQKSLYTTNTSNPTILDAYLLCHLWLAQHSASMISKPLKNPPKPIWSKGPPLDDSNTLSTSPNEFSLFKILETKFPTLLQYSNQIQERLFVKETTNDQHTPSEVSKNQTIKETKATKWFDIKRWFNGPPKSQAEQKKIRERWWWNFYRNLCVMSSISAFCTFLLWQGIVQIEFTNPNDNDNDEDEDEDDEDDEDAAFISVVQLPTDDNEGTDGAIDNSSRHQSG